MCISGKDVNMYISKIKIKNYRLLIDAELEVDAKTTLIVGRNNTAKTSCLHIKYWLHNRDMNDF